jgi:predicted aldo/keto reductase-like oxidoreductase
MNTCFPEVKKNFGFGCMRLPTQGDEIDLAAFSDMVDAFLENGFNYFDTAHGYHSGKSETALRACLTSRYPREAYVLVNKLSSPYFETNEEIRPFFESQLARCGVDYFDFYLMHAQTKALYEKFKRCRAYETAFELKKEGKIKHVGLSFHDKHEVLAEILREYPEIEAVQIQFNYIDYEDPSVEARACLEVCLAAGKPVIVMEPVKGGKLAALSTDAKSIFDALGGSPASYAIRYAASAPGVFMVLSGMSDMAMVEENIGFMRDFRPLDEGEREAVDRVCALLRAQDTVPCTACCYCTDGCPAKIPIPQLFSCLNSKRLFEYWNSAYYYKVHTEKGGKASDCIGCGACEEICPQHLSIRELLRIVATEFEKKDT